MATSAALAQERPIRFIDTQTQFDPQFLSGDGQSWIDVVKRMPSESAERAVCPRGQNGDGP